MESEEIQILKYKNHEKLKYEIYILKGIKGEYNVRYFYEEEDRYILMHLNSSILDSLKINFSSSFEKVLDFLKIFDKEPHIEIYKDCNSQMYIGDLDKHGYMDTYVRPYSELAEEINLMMGRFVDNKPAIFYVPQPERDFIYRITIEEEIE